MPRRNSTVEIVDGKVVFSEEVLSYFESIRTEENSIWIDKYFEYLSDESNLSATKYKIYREIYRGDKCVILEDKKLRYLEFYLK